MRIAVALLLYVASGILTAVGLLMLKNAAPALRAGEISLATLLPLAAGFLVYGTSFLCFTALLWWQRLGTAYPISIGVTVLSSFAVSLYWLAEPWGWRSAVGAVLILCGIVLVGIPSGAGGEGSKVGPR